jgi:lysophospholipase L1-like esterase
LDPSFFKDDTINRGVSGQTTAQMVGRFRADVIELHPKAVLILGGTNDIAGNTGPTSLAWIEDNIQAMVELAEAHHIRVILGSVPPASSFSWRPGIRPIEAINALNSWLRTYAQSNGLIYVDYYTALSDGNGGFTKSLTTDGVHPNAEGYRTMRPLAEHAIREGLQSAAQ